MSDLASVIRAAVRGSSEQIPASNADFAGFIVDSGETKSANYSAGFRMQTARLGNILGAAGIKGDPRRMEAAFKIAANSPNMEEQAIIDFITENVSSYASRISYEERRISAAATAHASFDGSGRSVLAKAVAITNSRVRAAADAPAGRVGSKQTSEKDRSVLAGAVAATNRRISG